jgi:hypothetical protein
LEEEIEEIENNAPENNKTDDKKFYNQFLLYTNFIFFISIIRHA